MPLFASLFSRPRAARTSARPAVARSASLEALEDRRLLAVSVVSTVDNATTLGNGGSREPSVSADGRYVVFSSAANNLVPGDTNNVSDVFLRDTQTGDTVLISAANGGTTIGNGASDEPSISADGLYVSFRSAATDLVTSDTNGQTDIFLRAWQDNVTIRVSADATGPNATGNANDFSAEPFTSANGRFVAFTSRASDLTDNPAQDRGDVPLGEGQTGRVIDVFLRDMGGNPTNPSDDDTVMVSVTPAGISGNGRSFDASVSEDGRFVAFRSEASDLVTGDTNGFRDIFVRDMQTGVTRIVSVPGGGGLANGNSDSPSISRDGNFVVFSSTATNLTPNDTDADPDVFVHNLATGVTTLVSINQLRTGSGNGPSTEPTISQEGRYVAFTSGASDLVAGDNNNSTDIFVYDIQSGALNMVSVNQAGRPAQGNSRDAFVAPGGEFVAFSSDAIDLVANDGNNASDAFLASAPNREGDNTAPTAALPAAGQPSNVVDATTLQFSVTYNDDVDLATSSFTNGDVQVTPPGGGAPVTANYVSHVGSGKAATVTYSIPAPGGTVNDADNGAYTINVVANEVRDAAGNAVAAGSLGTVTVTAVAAEGPDLEAAFVGTIPPAVGGARGGKATVAIRNSGTQPAVARRMVVTLFLSADPLLDPSDTQVATKTMNYRANPGARPKNAKFKFNWPNPSGGSTGYQLLAHVDATNVLAERAESNNVAFTPVTVAPPFVDLTGTVGAIPASMVAGQRVRIPLSVLNSGNVPAVGTVTYRVLASTDGTLSSNDIELASLPKRLALKPTPRPRNVPLAFAVPTTLTAGTYNLLVQINYTGAVAESNTTNNVAASTGTFTVA